MEVKDLMTENPACCMPETSMREVANLMVDNDCGEIPILDENKNVVGVVTDRDIACRGIAQGKGQDTPVGEIMSNPVITVTPETDIHDCCNKMEQNQIRRIPVVDENGVCCGMVSQADIARNATGRETAEMVREVSQPAYA